MSNNHRFFYVPWRESLLRGEQSWTNDTHDLMLLSAEYGVNINNKSLDQIPAAAILGRASIDNPSVSGTCLFADGVLFEGCATKAGKVAAIAIYNVSTDTLVLYNASLIGRNMQVDESDLQWEWATCGIACYCEPATGGCR